MRFVLIVFLGLLSSATPRTNTRALTESMGQEVIEIGAPIKDLPPDLEEEPSAEAEDSDTGTSTSLEPATPRDARKYTVMDARRKLKDIDKIDKVKQEDDEARIEKELADLYKDTDYKADSAEITQVENVTSLVNNTEKPVARMRNSFKFQPDRNNPSEVNWFRTSVDDINCSNKDKLSGGPKNSGFVTTIGRTIFWGIFALI